MGDGLGNATAAEKQGVVDTIKKIWDGLIEVKVVTLVGQVSVELKDDKGRTVASVTRPDGPADALVTTLNLVDGDITNIVAPNLKDDASLREFHTAQVEKALAVLPHNIEALLGFASQVFGVGEGSS